MTPIRLAPALQAAGTRSAREMFRSTGSPDRSLFRQSQMALVHSFYLRTGGARGPLGFPLKNIQFTGLVASRRYAGGQIALQGGEASGERRAAVRIRYVGLKCLKESGHDQLSGSDEPYFLISVLAANGSRVSRFAYEDINKKSTRSNSNLIASAGIEGGENNFVPPIALSVVAAEHDEGNKDEAEAKVRKVLEKAEAALDAAAKVVGPLIGIPIDNHVIPEELRDLGFGHLPELGAALLGLGDDKIGDTSRVLFDHSSEIEEWRAPAVLGLHEGNEYNFVLPVGGAGEGEYQLFFKVDLFDLQATIRPTV